MTTRSHADQACLSTALIAALLGGNGQTLPPELVDALGGVLKSALSEALTDVLPAVIRRASLPAYLTRDELADLTGWSVRKIDYRRQVGLLPYTRVGRSIRFRTADVESLLDEARVEARVRPTD